MTYRVTAEIDGRFWLIRVPVLDRVTQARSVREIPMMAKDLIRIMTDEVEPVIEVEYLLPDEVREQIALAESLRVEEAEARAEAARAIRRAAKALHDLRLPLRDVGAVLGVSHQRAHQLVSGRGGSTTSQ